MLSFKPLKSKTFWGSVLTAAALVLQQDAADPATIAEAAGIVLAALGLRDAVGKRTE